MEGQKNLPDVEHHLLLPRAHVHLFSQVVIVVFGILSFATGVVLYILSLTTSILESDLFAPIDEIVLIYLIAGLLMGLGVSLIISWALWKFVKKYRKRFLISFIVSAIAITVGLLSIVIQDTTSALKYTFYFFSVSLGMFVGLLSIFYFFKGLARHIFRTHKHNPS